MNRVELIEKAYHDLRLDKHFSYRCNLVYSGRFSDFNAKACMKGNDLEFRLSRKWELVDEDIIIGLIQDLLTKLLKIKKDTFNMQLYRIFIKNMHHAVEKKEIDPVLEASFERVNDGYFGSQIECPNLRFGKDSYRTLGSYNFHTDTITITGLFVDAPVELIDYVMYHELLHKKLQFDHTRQKVHHHTKTFREHESAFLGYKDVERRISLFLKSSVKKGRK